MDPRPASRRPGERRRSTGSHRVGRAVPPDAPLPPHLDPRRDPGRRFGGVRRLAKIAAALVSVAVLAVTGVAWATYRSATHNITHLDAIPTNGGSPSSGGSGAGHGTEQNILVIGDDSRTGLTAAQLHDLSTQADGGGINTDTLMLVHLPADGSRATAVSLPRDLWVEVPGYGRTKLNSVFAIGSHGRTDRASRTAGFRLLIRTISGITGVHIDHFIEVDLWGFYSISKAIGGVQVDLCHAVDDHYSGLKLPAGSSTVEGSQALAFVRQRHGLPRGDLDRERRQQYFIGAVFRKVRSAGVLLNPVRLDHLLNAATRVLTTDPGLDPIKLVDQMRGLTAGALRFTTIPITGEPTIDGQDVITYDPAAVKSLFSRLEHPVPPHRHPSVARRSVHVVVNNANGTAGSAARTATALSGRGFRARVGGNLPVLAGTRIRYSAAQAAAAHAVAAAMPHEQVRLVPDPAAGGAVQVDLGTGFTALSTAPPTHKAQPSRTAATRGCIN